MGLAATHERSALGTTLRDLAALVALPKDPISVLQTAAEWIWPG